MGKLQIGWVDFSKEQKNKVLNVLNLLTESQAVDELGVGIIRDAFSDRLFPGTSTIQTRAKYFLIVPYLLYELENGSQMTADNMVKELHKKEIGLIDELKELGENGIIGEVAGATLKRKPSDIYWNGIRRYGIFTGGNMSLNNYAKAVFSIKTENLENRTQGDSKIIIDDNEDFLIGSSVESIGKGFWKLSKFNKEWRKNLSINLKREEAEFLKSQIIANCSGTLIELVLRENHKSFIDLESFDDIPYILPDNIRDDYLMAKSFANFILGAHLRFNIILSEGDNDELNTEWDSWYLNIEEHSNIDLNYILYSKLKIKNRSLNKFLFDCKESMKIRNINRLDDIIIRRERTLKGDSRSKLYNLSEFEYEKWVGIGKLQYRMQSAQRIVKDIFESLGDEYV